MGMNRGGGDPRGGIAQAIGRGAPPPRVGMGGIADRFRQQQAAQGRMARPIAPPPNRGGMGPGRMQQQQMMAQQMRRGARPAGPPNPTGNRAPMRPTMGPGGRRNYR